MAPNPTLPVPASQRINQEYTALAAEVGDLHFKKQVLEEEIAARVKQVKQLEEKFVEYVQRKLHLHNALQEAVKAEQAAKDAEEKAQEAVRQPEKTVPGSALTAKAVAEDLEQPK